MATSARSKRAAADSPNQDSQAFWDAIHQSQALISFHPDGTVRSANAGFCKLLGYREAALVGKPHTQLLPRDAAATKADQQLWQALRRGKPQAGEVRLISQDGHDVWLQASYTPLPSGSSQPEAIVAIATDITEAKNRSAADAGAIQAIERSMAVIEFEPNGTILRANAIFLAVMGYREEEIVGQPHRLFVEKQEADSAAYRQFWDRLGQGEFQRGQFKRINKAGQAVWLEAAYNPIFDAGGTLVKVVKFAYDVTDQFNQAMAVLGEKSAQLEAALEESREAERVRLELDRTLQEMSTPVTPIWDEILLLPLVGIVDSTRTDDVMRKTLDRISQTGSKMFILDISGVPTVDTAVANQLIKITKATRIMGCETLVSGVSSAIAHTIVELGVDISELRTTATLRDAFSTCLSEMGVLSLPGNRHGNPGYPRGMQRPMHGLRSLR